MNEQVKKCNNPIRLRIDELQAEVSRLHDLLKASTEREKKWSENVDKLLSLCSSDNFKKFTDEEKTNLIKITLDCAFLSLQNFTVFDSVLSRHHD